MKRRDFTVDDFIPPFDVMRKTMNLRQLKAAVGATAEINSTTLIRAENDKRDITTIITRSEDSVFLRVECKGCGSFKVIYDWNPHNAYSCGDFACTCVRDDSPS